MLIQFRAAKAVSEESNELAYILAEAEVEHEQTIRVAFDIELIQSIQEAKINGQLYTFLQYNDMWYKIAAEYEFTRNAISKYREVVLAQD